MKKTFIIVGLCCLLAVIILIAFFIFKPSPESSSESSSESPSESSSDTPELQDIIGETLSLSQATMLICEFSDADLSDDFSKTFTEKATITILSINEEGTSATVKISTPDMEHILRNSLPADDATGDYEVLFEQYWNNITTALTNVKQEQMITQTVECPVIEQDNSKQISVANVPLFNYEQVLADALLEILSEKEG